MQLFAAPCSRHWTILRGSSRNCGASRNPPARAARHSRVMRRRELILALSGAIMAARALHAQQKAMPVIGFLGLAYPLAGATPRLLAAFRQGLGETGFLEGQNAAVEYRWAEGQYDRLPALAADLVGRRVDVIVTNGGERVAVAAKTATSTIPIVSGFGGDPVEGGLVASLARPGGNLTGFTLLPAALTAKRLELLSELVLQTRMVALMVNPNYPPSERIIRDAQEAARVKGVLLQILRASTEAEIDGAFVQLRADALIVGADPFFGSRLHQLVALAARYAVPAIYEWPSSPKRVAWSATGRASPACGANSAFMSGGFSRARSPPICRSSSQRPLSS
jgi:putative tryptophan/tyrosine transport system substrate-binding protein